MPKRKPIERYALYIGSAKHGHNGISIHETRRDAYITLIDTVNNCDEMILNDDKIDAMCDDELADAAHDYADGRGFDYYVEHVTI